MDCFALYETKHMGNYQFTPLLFIPKPELPSFIFFLFFAIQNPEIRVPLPPSILSFKFPLLSLCKIESASAKSKSKSNPSSFFQVPSSSFSIESSM